MKPHWPKVQKWQGGDSMLLVDMINSLLGNPVERPKYESLLADNLPVEEIVTSPKSPKSLLADDRDSRLAPRPKEKPVQLAPRPKEKPVPTAFKYFDKNVAGEELGESDRGKHYDEETDSYRVYQLKGEDRPTVGKGVYLNDAALKRLNLSEVPSVGQLIPANVIDQLAQNRWMAAVKRASRELTGTKGEKSIGPLAEMIYQMGSQVVTPGKNNKKYFGETLKSLKLGNLEEAKKHAKNSTWYKQTTNRANRVIGRFGRSKL